MAIYRLLKVQLGQEVTWGTPVAATAILMGFKSGSIVIADEMYQTEESGVLYPSKLVTQVKQSASGSIDYDLSYEDAIYLGDGVFGDCSPVGAGDPYTWAYAAPTTTAIVPREYTLEFGTTGGEYEAEGAIFNDFTIDGDVDGDGIWQASVNFMGQIVAATAATAALTARVVEMIRMADTKLYIDAVAGTIGTTEVETALIAFSLSVDPGHHLKTFGGSINPASIGTAPWTGSLSLTLEYTAAVKAFVDALISAKVEKQISLVATSTSHTATIDFAGYLEGQELFGDRDGNLTCELTWIGSYNSTLTNWLEMTFLNAVATLP